MCVCVYLAYEYMTIYEYMISYHILYYYIIILQYIVSYCILFFPSHRIEYNMTQYTII